MAKYWTTQPRYLKQRGDSEPQMVAGSPNSPVLVDLEYEIPLESQRRFGWIPVDEPLPPKPQPAHAAPAPRRDVKSSAENARKL